MGFTGLLRFCMALMMLLMFNSFSGIYGQEPVKCKVKDKSLRAVKYRIGRTERSRLSPTGPPVLAVDVSVKAEQINADYLILLARHLKQRFCREERLVTGIFDRYEIAVRFKPEFKDAVDAYRGEYFLDRSTGEEYISFTTIPDYMRNPQARIRIDLNTGRSSSCK